MSLGRRLCGGFIFLLLGLQGWTQYLAYQYGYQPALGTPLWQVQAFYMRHRVYAPWQAFLWVWAWRLPPGRLGLVALGLGLVALLSLWGRWLWRRRQGPPPMTGHGTTQWATARDIRRAQLR